MYFAHQAVHSANDPEHALQAPKKYYDRFPNITDENRRTFAGKNAQHTPQIYKGLDKL